MSASARTGSAHPKSFEPVVAGSASGDVLRLAAAARYHARQRNRRDGCAIARPARYRIGRQSVRCRQSPRSSFARRSASISAGSFEWPCRFWRAFAAFRSSSHSPSASRELALGLLLPLGVIVAPLPSTAHAPAFRRALDHPAWRGPYRTDLAERPAVCRDDQGRRRRGDRGRQARYQGPDLHHQHPAARRGQTFRSPTRHDENGAQCRARGNHPAPQCVFQMRGPVRADRARRGC